MPYRVTLVFVVEAESEEILERYVDRLAYDVATRERFLLDNREIRTCDTPLPGSYRTVTEDDLPYTGV
ncbi:MAG: hypothetical protein IT201_05390 [Thermoleophilia bacterium]|nr:hypothetical protein [Thermoleophilia bacterium]